MAERAKEHGPIAHRFYRTDDGWIMVIDEWLDAGSFQRFFESNRPASRARPEIQFWQKLDTNDDVGWES